MPEVALAVPFEVSEIKKIVCDELMKRMDGLSPMQGSKEYASFEIYFEVKIRLGRTGEAGASKETLAWGRVKGERGTKGKVTPKEASISDSYKSKTPNQEREDRDMPMTVESGDGKGGRIRKKVNVRR